MDEPLGGMSIFHSFIFCSVMSYSAIYSRSFQSFSICTKNDLADLNSNEPFDLKLTKSGRSTAPIIFT